MVQLELLKHIVKTTLSDLLNIDDFNNKRVYPIKLSTLQRHYDGKDSRIINSLSEHQVIYIDSKFRLKLRTGYILMNIGATMLDFQLTVAK